MLPCRVPREKKLNISAMIVLLGVVALSLFRCTAAQDDVIFATIREDDNLATRLNCRVEEAEHFEYSSVVELWGSDGGRIIIDADIILHCLGADVDGKYGNQALKYNVHISDLKMTQETASSSVLRRERRGAKDFITNSWRKVKQFFNRMFGKKTDEEEPRSTTQDGEPEEVSSYEGVYSVPFQMVQLANGTVPELRFSENEVDDGRVRNFKRHLADAFSTHLSRSDDPVLENSVMGEHTTTYNITTMDEEKESLSEAGWSVRRKQHRVVVKKSVTQNDIVRLAPSEALNDRNRMHLDTLQTQVFMQGRMVSSSGSASFNLLTEDVKNRKRRAIPEDATFQVRARTSFTIQSRKRRRRSTEESHRFQEEANSFRPVSRVAEDEDESEKKRQLQKLHKTVNFSDLFGQLSGDEMEEDVMQSLSEILEKEARLKLGEGARSLSSAIREILTLEKIKEICSTDFSQCEDYLHLLALAGGSQAETVILQLLKEVESKQMASVCDILNDLPRPSSHLVRAIGDILVHQKPQVQGALAICLSNLASESGEEGSAVDVLIPLLGGGCEGESLIDLLEAVGNLRSHERLIPRVMQISEECGEESAVQIACAHALRHSTHVSSVQKWIERVVRSGDCDVTNEVVGAILDESKDREKTPDVLMWPDSDFDVLLEGLVAERKCSSKDILRYLNRKRTGPRRQKRRALWDDAKCEEWTADSNYSPVQGKDEFDVDRATYNKRKSCLAYRRIGLKGANAQIYAGMFAGLKEPSDPPKYKLFTKFVSELNVLDYQTEVGSFYFYLLNGKTKAYVRVMGRTRQEFTHEGCTPTELKYRPLKHLPLYMVSIANVQLSLGIQLSSRLALDTLCPAPGVFLLQPLTDVRVGGEALGTALFIRGAASLGANFNYKLQFTFTPSPNMCLNGSHGFDPMDINFESYFQVWNAAKEDWGKVRSWKPSLVFWRIREGRMKQWFKETCIAAEEGGVLSERELE